MIKVMRTDGKDSVFMNSSSFNPVQLFIISSENCNEDHHYGDLLKNEDESVYSKFAILGKEYVGSKMNTEFVRTGLILLARDIKNMISFPDDPLSIIINRYQFRNEHEIDKFECIFTGVMYTMLSDEELEALSLIITDCDNVDDDTTMLAIDEAGKEND